eukprot:4805608-Alexandrium_andersonii.AAC.1
MSGRASCAGALEPGALVEGGSLPHGREARRSVWVDQEVLRLQDVGALTRSFTFLVVRVPSDLGLVLAAVTDHPHAGL